MPRNLPPYMVLKGGRYYCRLAVPKQLQAILGKKQLWAKLDGDLSVAKKLLSFEQSRLQATIDNARIGAVPPEIGRPALRSGLLSPRELANDIYTADLLQDTILRNHNLRTAGPGNLSEKILKEKLKLIAAGLLSDDETNAILGDILAEYFERGQVKAEFATPEWRELMRQIAGIQIEKLNRTAERDEGDWTGKPKHPLLVEVDNAANNRNPRYLKEESNLPVGKIAERLIAEKQCSSATANEYRVSARMLEEHLGSARPVFLITADDMINFKDALLRTPSNYTKRFPDMTLPQAIKANGKLSKPHPTLATVTIADKWLPRISSILKYAVANRFIPDNPSSSVKIDVSRSQRTTKREEFTPMDLGKILANPRELARDMDGEKFWAIMVALYTGARASEIAQLKLDSIRKESGVLVFAIEEQAKNEQSLRLVPVSERLVRLGLNKRIKMLRKNGQTHLFPHWYNAGQKYIESALRKGGVQKQPYSQVIPRWFNRTYLPSLGIHDKGKVFHSFRHTMKSGLARAEVGRDVSDRITGHEDGSSGGRYVHFSLETLQAAVNKVAFRRTKSRL